MEEIKSRGSILFSSCKPPVPVDIFSCPVPPSSEADEVLMTDGKFDNYNCQVIPPAALKTILRRPKLAPTVHDDYVDSGRLTGLIFVSKRDQFLETLHIALRLHHNIQPIMKVFSLADIYDADVFSGIRMEDGGCIAGGYEVGAQTIDHFLIYVSTKNPKKEPRGPWNVVYQTNLKNGETKCLTPPGTSDLSPSVSPCGKKIAVASFQETHWHGHTDVPKTSIYMMNVETPLERKLLVKNGGWPTWGSDKVIFFHRKVDEIWGVFRLDISTDETTRVTPEDVDACTPAAISETKVAVAITYNKTLYGQTRHQEQQYRHVEIFDTSTPGQPLQITQKIRPRVDHFNPFVIDGGQRIGYHRCNVGLHQNRVNIRTQLQKHQSPLKDVELFRLSGVICPTISEDGLLAFLDCKRRAVWLVGSQGPRIVLEVDRVIPSIIWNKNPNKDRLYFCMEKPTSGEPMQIFATSPKAAYSRGTAPYGPLTKGKFYNASPHNNACVSYL